MIKSNLNKIVGDEYVLEGSSLLQDHFWCGHVLNPQIPEVVVKPKSSEELQKIVQLANESKVPLYPLSSLTHFQGSAIPLPGAIALDLSRMNQIINVDERNRAVRIQPGVTWGQLDEELKKHKLTPLNPLLPHKDKSALTSSMEREPMLIPKTEYGEKVLTMEVVLSSGNLFRTGSAAVGEPDKTQVDLVGFTGPGIDFYRLFKGSQGTFGIFTWINMKAPCRPAINKFFYLPIRELGECTDFIYDIQKKMIGAECILLNRFNLSIILSGMECGKREELFNILPPYLVILCLSGLKRMPEKKINYEEKAVKTSAQQYGLKLEEEISGVKISQDQINCILNQPWPGEVYWKEMFKKGFFELFFYAPFKKVPQLSEIISAEATSEGYPIEEIGLYIQPIERARASYIEVRFQFDPLKNDEKKRVESLFLKLSQRVFDAGGHCIRPYGPWEKMVFDHNPDLKEIVKKMKEVFDPNRILNPPVFCF